MMSFVPAISDFIPPVCETPTVLRGIPFVAQVVDDLELPEVTPGTIAAGSLVMCALAGSLVVTAQWIARWSRGEPAIPAASRPLLKVPPLFTGLGMLLAGFMAITTILVSVGYLESALTTRPDAAEIDRADGKENDEPPAEKPATDEPVDGGPQRPPMTADQFIAALIQTVYFDIGLLVALGIPVLLLKAVQNRNEREQVIASVRQDSEGYVASFAIAVDEDPYAPPACHDTAAFPAEPDRALVAPEPWHFGRELRYASETCLAAWLPTALLRVVILVLINDDIQHPFLEMMQQGVPVTVFLLIALTAVVLAPLMEELLYRVIILGGLITLLPSVQALSVSSVLFAFAHGFPDSLALLPLAFAIGWTYHQRRSYRTVVLVHFLFNGFNILLAGVSLL